MAISSPGIGSNLDVNGIVSKLMSVEQQPLIRLTQKNASYQAKISAVGTLKGSLSSLNSAAAALIPSSTQTAAEKFTSYKATIADTSVATVSTTSKAVAGTYSIEISQLAQAHRISTGADPTISNGTLTIELGSYTPDGAPTTFTRKTGTSAIDITIDTTNNTIEGVRDAINAAKAGVSATVINGTAGKQLLIESNTTGLESAIRISGTTGLDYDPTDVTVDTFSEKIPAKNAALKINSVDITSTSNTVSDAIEGITLTLKKGPTTESPANPVTTLTIARDDSSLKTQLEALVKAYNDANKTMKDLGGYDATTKKAGLLNGDSTIRLAQTQLRAVINGNLSGLSGNYQKLSDIGISLGKDGSMSLDSSKLSTALAADFSGVADLVAAGGTAFKTATDGLVGTAGILAARADGLTASSKSIDRQVAALSLRLQDIESRYRKQFSALDSLLAGLSQTSSYLQQQLANLPKVA